MDVETYRKTRYEGIDQKIVDNRERKILQKIFGHIDGKDIFVLDVPCGYGRFSDLLLKRSLNLTSIDISFAMVRAAKEYSPSQSSRHRFLVGDIEHLPLKDNSFDCVVTIRLFQHILQPGRRLQILRELHRVTKEIVILSFYRYNILHSIERWAKCRIKNVNKRISMLPLRSFAKEFNSAGFKMLNLFPVIRHFHAHNIVALQRVE